MGEPTFLSQTRTSYDTVAAAYASAAQGTLADAPLERALFAAFAEMVLAGGGSTVADIGSGPGLYTAYLAGLGLTAFGVDLSPGMVEQARLAYPQLTFREGSMLNLEQADGSVDGVMALFSIIHIPQEQLPMVFAEFHRVLSANGQLLLGFQVSDEPIQLKEWFGHPVSLELQGFSVEGITKLLSAAGFTVNAELLRQPAAANERVPRAYLLASR
jgi:ubiquinone/menaquinone biosynthesis C-methylase UbiE